ncbi:cell surface protein [Methanosarcina siciliae C2J]|uniref:Cell surface protein n=2 Tax=Methanosarcina siciliae TaxID=38027 RepID=A0A0E3PLR7_9EURY|nr:cell surface protein [Methanosarcina siciliae C2J]
MLILFSLIPGANAWESQEQAQPLEVVELSPADGGSMIGKDGEISLTFNQGVQFVDRGTPVQVAAFWDKDGQGDPGSYTLENFTKHELIFDEQEPAKVRVQLKDSDGNNISLQEGHVYKIVVVNGFIQSRVSGEKASENIEWTFSVNAAAQALELVEMTPADGGSLNGKDGEISLTYNQPVEIFDRGEPQVALTYDPNGDGNVDSPVLVNGKDDLGGTDGFYTNVLEISPDNPNKVLVKINHLLEEDHSYAIMVNSLIRVKGSTDTDPDSSNQVSKFIGSNYPEWTIKVEHKSTDLPGNYSLTIEEVVTRTEHEYDNIYGVTTKDGIVYAFKQYNQRLYTFDLYGHELWNVRFGDADAAPSSSGTRYHPVVGEDGTVYVQIKLKSGYSYNASVYAVNPEGAIKWNKVINETAISDNCPLVLGDQVIIGVKNGVYSLDTGDGSENWHYEINATGLNYASSYYLLAGSPTADSNGNIYVAIMGKNNVMADGKIQVLNSQGVEKWSHVTYEGIDKYVMSPAIGSSGTVYVTDDNQTIEALNPADGSIATEDPLNGCKIQPDSEYEIYKFFIGSDDTIYAYLAHSDTDYKKLTAINPDGTGKYVHQTTELAYPDAVDDEGYVYFDKQVGDLAGGYALISIGSNGEEADRIAPFGSSVASYNDIYVDGNVLVGGRSKFGKFIIATIERDNQPEVPASVEIIEKDKTFGLNKEETLGVRIFDTDGKAMAGQELEWESSDPDIIAVQGDGSFICNSTGNATITVTVKGTSISDNDEFNVIRKESKPSSVEILSETGEVINGSINVEYNIPYQFQAHVLDQYGDIMPNETVKWTCTINYANTMDQNGVLDPSATGTYTLIAESITDVTLGSQVNVVIEREPDRFGGILPEEIVMIAPGTVTAIPANQYGEVMGLESPVWTSSDETIAIVNNDGKITAVACGNATISCTAGNITRTRAVRVVPSFGYEWSMNCSKLNEFISQDSEGNVCCYDSSANKLFSIGPKGAENWNVSIFDCVYYAQTGADDHLYCLARDKDQNYVVSSIAPDKTVAWITTLNVLGFSNNIQQAADKTIYVAYSSAQSSTLYAIDNNGNEKWNINFNSNLLHFVLDSNGNIVCTTYDGNDTEIFVLEDRGNEGYVVSNQYTIENNYRLGGKNVIIDSNGVLYGYFYNPDLERSGVCAVENGSTNWEYYFNSLKDSGPDYPEILLGRNGTLYFTSELDERSILYSVDMQGNELWKKELKDLVGPDECVYAYGDLAEDDAGNLYIPLITMETSGWNKNAVESGLVKLNADGTIIKRINYPVEKYGQFSYISINDDSACVIGKYANDGDYLVKFSFDGSQELVPNEIRISGLKNSIIENDTLQLDAKVYSQLGSVMPNETVIWSSSDESIATVDENGLVTAISQGDANIVASLDSDPQIRGTYQISVVAGNQHYVNAYVLNEKTQLTIDYYKETGIQSDWTAFALWAAGEDINSEVYLTNGKSYLDRLWKVVNASENMGDITEYERTTMGILAAGYDPHDFAGMNLIEKIAYYPSISQGINAAIWALVAFNAADAQVPDDANYDQEYLINYLLEHKAGKGWSLGSDPDVDLTAMAIYALAPYYDERADVKAAVDEAVEWLKQRENENGSFNCFGSSDTNTESTAQVIMALTSLGIDPQGEDFERAGGNPVSALLGNQLSDGTFSHTPIGGSDGMATYQALQALAAVKQFNEKGISTIFTYVASPIELGFEPGTAFVIDGSESTIQLVADSFPEGLSGYNLTVAIDDPAVAEIVDIEYPSWALITENSSLPGTSIYLKAVDGNNTVKADASDVVLATLTVSGKEKGSTNLSIGIDRLDDDSGNVIDPTLLTGKIEVTLLSPLPDQEYTPKDLDGDGLYEDLTGNGEFSFVDIVAYFHNMDWIEANMPVEYFDFNGNGRIDFDDVVDMFGMI